VKNCRLLSAPTLSDSDANPKQVVMPMYYVIEYKSFFDIRKPDKPAANRVFCGDCLKPCRMLDDDLENILSKSDYCDCRRNRHA
jgi:hypothetical protein